MQRDAYFLALKELKAVREEERQNIRLVHIGSMTKVLKSC